MHVLALDTSTDVVTVGLVRLDAAGPQVLAELVRPGARQHGEQLMPAALEVCARAGYPLAEVDAVVCGNGPGPFTGLRVGLVSAAALGDALDVPVYGVCSLDAVAAVAAPGDPLVVVSDARRREVYWAAYDGAGRRTRGPEVSAPAALAGRIGELGVHRVAGPLAGRFAAESGLAELPGLVPTPAGLVAVARADLLARRAPDPLEPLYLRRPDAVPPAARKRVTA
ncbi:tRNA (adenosine(37)-N6)-threonylcarbamoyltransferase complex dimerization subunit type 1 TsaB [Pseudonocardia eucalypti]|uniref:tRNA (Adenosine(37)-N6)-threonylcarbamoyltransferase complex dimerization subunit type 1 TsaB n=1 Tax=Pseudonocardia eucalypti TaxID=648755 RepID=A0ABP9PIE9_9PSEU|nr:tRNA threonylcarbamoyl adenosine modification protein YeaZ [Pseudonocardia eucalypti]